MDEEIKKLLEQNLEYSQEIYKMTKKIKSHITFQKIVSIFYLFIIVVPVILSIIYLPPILKGLFDQYKDLLGPQAGAINPIESLLKGEAGNLNNVDINKLPANVRAMIK